MLKPRNSFAKEYHLKKCIDVKGLAEVWEAASAKNHIVNSIALKIFPWVHTAGIKEIEAGFAKQPYFDHGNLLSARRLGIYENRPFLEMHFCDNGSISRKVLQLSENEIAKCMHQISGALAYLHENSIIHGCIKPDNILIDGNSFFLYLADLGLSTELRETIERFVEVDADEVVIPSQITAVQKGSARNVFPCFCAPELFENSHEATSAADIWAFGASMFEMITGKLPFGYLGGEAQRKNNAVLKDIAQNFSVDFNSIIKKCLSKNIQDRPTAQEIEELSMNFLKGKRLGTTVEPIKPVAIVEPTKLTNFIEPIIPNVINEPIPDVDTVPALDTVSIESQKFIDTNNNVAKPTEHAGVIDESKPADKEETRPFANDVEPIINSTTIERQETDPDTEQIEPITDIDSTNSTAAIEGTASLENVEPPIIETAIELQETNLNVGQIEEPITAIEATGSLEDTGPTVFVTAIEPRETNLDIEQVEPITAIEPTELIVVIEEPKVIVTKVPTITVTSLEPLETNLNIEQVEPTLGVLPAELTVALEETGIAVETGSTIFVTAIEPRETNLDIEQVEPITAIEPTELIVVIEEPKVIVTKEPTITVTSLEPLETNLNIEQVEPTLGVLPTEPIASFEETGPAVGAISTIFTNAIEPPETNPDIEQVEPITAIEPKEPITTIEETKHDVGAESTKPNVIVEPLPSIPNAKPIEPILSIEKETATAYDEQLLLPITAIKPLEPIIDAKEPLKQKFFATVKPAVRSAVVNDGQNEKMVRWRSVLNIVVPSLVAGLILFAYIEMSSDSPEYTITPAPKYMVTPVPKTKEDSTKILKKQLVSVNPKAVTNKLPAKKTDLAAPAHPPVIVPKVVQNKPIVQSTSANAVAQENAKKTNLTAATAHPPVIIVPKVVQNKPTAQSSGTNTIAQENAKKANLTAAPAHTPVIVPKVVQNKPTAQSSGTNTIAQENTKKANSTAATAYLPVIVPKVVQNKPIVQSGATNVLALENAKKTNLSATHPPVIVPKVVQNKPIVQSIGTNTVPQENAKKAVVAKPKKQKDEEKIVDHGIPKHKDNEQAIDPGIPKRKDREQKNQ